MSDLRKQTHQYSHGYENPKWSLLKCRTASRPYLYSRRFPTGHRRQQYFFLPGITSFISSNISHILLAPSHTRATSLGWSGANSASTVTSFSKITYRRNITVAMSAPSRINRSHSLPISPSYVCGGERTPRIRKDEVVISNPLRAGTPLPLFSPPAAIMLLCQDRGFVQALGGLAPIIRSSAFMDQPVLSFKQKKSISVFGI